ncbi:MAG TPA: hypothetical protein VFT87_02380 [Candidatus Saccharimonadales bacterium]|nr:hypothetical protein [Candidatus Saccharimonadales bacterium]
MQKSSKTKIILFSVVAVVVIILALFGVKSYLVDQPKNLGPNLEYLGKRHTGCPLPLPLGYLLLCSSEPGEEYYFGTDMSEEELENYFTKAHSLGTPTTGTSDGHSFKLLSFQPDFSNDIFYITYFENSEIIRDSLNKKTDNKTVLKVSDSDYNLARSCL